MIGYLKGKVKELTREYVILEVNGVGYEVVCSSAAFSRLSGGTDGEVYTYMHVSDNGIALYGFADVQEKSLFIRIIGVSGIGPKKAMILLSAMTPQEIVNAINLGDGKRLAAVKGFGAKLSNLLLASLNGKLSADELIGVSGENASFTAASSQEDDDAVSALMGLGFTRQESMRAVERAKKAGAKTVEDILGMALKGM